MGKPLSALLSRRGFVKLAAVTGAAAALSGAGGAPSALAETDKPAQTGEVKRVRTACRACGKMECGVWVTVQDGRAVRVEGDETAWHSGGNCCTKSQSSIQAAYHPNRIYHPMKRTNPKDAADPGWVRISWDEAISETVRKLQEVADRYGGETLINTRGTSRMWAMGGSCLTKPLGGINDVGANQICKGPRREAGSLTIENGIFFQANVDHPAVFVQWGTEQTQSNYDDSCRVVAETAHRAQTYISIDPRKTNLGKEADYHLDLRPGSDAALALGWTRIVMEKKLYDDLIVKRWSNAPFLYCEDIEPTGGPAASLNCSAGFELKTRLLKESDLVEGGSYLRFMVWDNINGRLTYFDADEKVGMWEGQTEHDVKMDEGFEYERGGWVPDVQPFPVDIDPALWGEFEVTLKDGRTVKAKPVFQKYWDEVVQEWTLERTAEVCDLDPQLIEDACLAWATRIDPRHGNGGLNAQLAPEQVGRAIQTFRAIYLLSFMTDNYDTPGGNRGITRVPAVISGPKGPCTPSTSSSVPNWEKRAKICGADKFPMTRWWDSWADCTSVWDAAHTGEPYPIKGCVMETGDFMHQSNSLYAWEALMQMDFMVAIDLWYAPTVNLADILLPAEHWIEIPGWARVSQGASGAYGANVRCVEPPADCKSDPEILIDCYKEMGIPWYDTSDGGDAWDRPFEETLSYCVKDLAPSWEEYERNFTENGWSDAKEMFPERYGTYRRYTVGYLRQKDSMSVAPLDYVPGMGTPTMKAEFWSTILESYMGQDEFPVYQEPPLSPVSTPELYEKYPFNMTTGRRIPVYFHSEHRQLPWCRELWPAPRIEINPEDAAELGIEQGDWVWIENDNGKVRQVADLYSGINRGVVNCEHSWWYPELEQADKGFKLSGINCLVYKDAQDPICGASQLRAYPVNIYKATPENSPFGNPVPCGDDGTEIIHDSSDPRLKEWLPDYEIRKEA